MIHLATAIENVMTKDEISARRRPASEPVANDAAKGKARVSTRIVQDMAGLQGLRESWNELNATGRYRGPFLSWTWHDAWCRHFTQPGGMFIIVAEDPAGTVQAIAPLMKLRRRVNGLAVREVRFLENAIAPRHSFLIRKEACEDEAVDAIVACLAAHRREWNLVTLENIDCGSLFLGCLRNSIEKHGLHRWETAGFCSPYVDFGGDFTEYLATLGSKHRSDVKRNARRLLSQQDYRLLEFTAPENIMEGLSLAFRVSEASWKKEKGFHMAETAERRQFYKHITERFAELGQVRIYIAMLGDHPIALEYQVVDNDTVYLLINDFDRRHRALAPGTVLLYQAIERFCSSSQNCFDFCGAHTTTRNAGPRDCDITRSCRFLTTDFHPIAFSWPRAGCCRRFVAQETGFCGGKMRLRPRPRLAHHERLSVRCAERMTQL